MSVQPDVDQVRWVEAEAALYPQAHLLVGNLTLCGHEPNRCSWTGKFWNYVAKPVVEEAICGNCQRAVLYDLYRKQAEVFAEELG